MKKIVIAVVVLVAFLVVAPWGVGRLAEKRLDHGLDQIVQAAPYLTIVERKYTPGWFKSEQVVTFEVFSTWMKALNPKAVEEAMRKAENAEGAEPAVAAAADPATDAAVPAEAPKPDEVLRFTVRNEILHGPVLGLTGLGIARVDSHIVMSDKVQKEIEEIFGPKDPLEIRTRVGFFGGGTTTFRSEGRTIRPKDSKAEFSWETFKLAVRYSKNADSYDLDGKWPKVAVIDHANQTNFVLTDMSIDGDGKRALGDLYDGDVTFGIKQVAVTGKDGDNVEINDLHYIVNVETKNDFMGMNAKLGSGAVKAKGLADLGIVLKEIHYDFGLRHMHAPTLQKMAVGMKAMYAKPLPSAADIDKVMFAPLKENAAELLKYDPEFVIDRMGIVTPEGDGYIKGLVKLRGATVDDFATGSMSIIGKIDADITIDVSEKMVQKFPNGSTSAGAMVDAGYAKRQGDRLVCKIRFVKGQLTVNGKPQAIPGLGGPPPGTGEEAPPPQE